MKSITQLSKDNNGNVEKHFKEKYHLRKII